MAFYMYTCMRLHGSTVLSCSLSHHLGKGMGKTTLFTRQLENVPKNINHTVNDLSLLEVDVSKFVKNKMGVRVFNRLTHCIAF